MIIGFKKFPYAKSFATTTDGLVSHLETERAVLYVSGGFDVQFSEHVIKIFHCLEHLRSLAKKKLKQKF